MGEKGNRTIGFISIVASGIILLYLIGIIFSFIGDVKSNLILGIIWFLLLYLSGPILIGVTGLMYLSSKEKIKLWISIMLIISIVLELIAMCLVLIINSMDSVHGLEYLAVLPPHFLGTLLAIISFVATIISKKRRE